MLSKRIVISFIVICCLVHFITCQNTKDDKKKIAQNPSKPPVNQTPQDRKKLTSNSPTSTTTKPRGLPPKNNEDSKGNGNVKSPTKPADKPMKPAAADKNKETAGKTADNPGGDEEPAEEKPVGHIRKAFRRLNKFRKKICPFRFFGRLIKKSIGLQKAKPTDDENP